jgi:transcriptional regulator with XRE-family HTH domain
MLSRWICYTIIPKREVSDMNGNRLKQARILAGHTQVSLGELIKVDARQIWRWESGEHIPKADVIVEIARALEVSSDFLLGLDDNIPPNTDLSEKERAIIMAIRLGDKLEAIKMIAND